MPAAEKLRLDKYLWAIRVFKTRSQASAACEEGKIKMNGQALKAARTVSLGDQYDIRTPARKWTIKVTGLIQQRQGYEEAIKNYVDLTSEEDLALSQRQRSSFFTGKRQSNTGKMTKTQRRQHEDYMEGGEEEEL